MPEESSNQYAMRMGGPTQGGAQPGVGSMGGAVVDIKENLAAGAGAFIFPFGPQFLCFFLNEEIRLRLLQSIENFRLDPSKLDPEIVKNLLTGDGYEHQKNSITDGELYMITGLDPLVDDIVLQLVKLYATNYMNIDSKIGKHFNFDFTAIWFGVMKQGDFHIIHEHSPPPNTFHHMGEVSGAIYLQIPENLPDPQGKINWIFSGAQEELSSSLYSILPQPGEVFVWPAWLKHMVYPFRGEGERIMISFNGHWE